MYVFRRNLCSAVWTNILILIIACGGGAMAEELRDDHLLQEVEKTTSEIHLSTPPPPPPPRYYYHTLLFTRLLLFSPVFSSLSLSLSDCLLMSIYYTSFFRVLFLSVYINSFPSLHIYASNLPIISDIMLQSKV